jgi:single-stranded-DNA-specific exonuclease
MGNPSPMFACRGVRLARDPRIVKDEHAKLLVEDDTGRIDVIGFGMADRVRDFAHGDRLDIAFLLQIDDWSGRRRPQARLIDVRAAEGGSSPADGGAAAWTVRRAGTHARPPTASAKPG